MPRCFGRRHFARDQVLGDGDEIVVGALAIFLARGVMPVGPELAAAADVGDAHTRRLFPAKPAPTLAL